MYSYIIGNVIEKGEGYVVLENNGIGYEIFVTKSTLDAIAFENEPVKIYTYFQVREDGIALYGFYTRDEKELFLKIITISGIGPKMAITMLSSITVSEFINAILLEDIRKISNIKGLGKKTAERVILELKDKVSLAGTIITPLEASINEDAINDATEALISLGVGKNEAYRLAKQYAGQTNSVEEIITKVLRNMG